MPNKDRPATDPSLPEHFFSGMNAATSRFGVLCDIPLTFAAIALLAIAAAIAYQLVPGLPTWIAGVVLAIPILVCTAAHVALRNARRGVVAWLRTLPFPVENAHAVLAGSGEYYEIYMRDRVPDREVVMRFLERASEHTFVVEQDEERNVVAGRFGVMDSHINPYRAAYLRYERMRKVVEQSLVPMHNEYPIERVLIT